MKFASGILINFDHQISTYQFFDLVRPFFFLVITSSLVVCSNVEPKWNILVLWQIMKILIDAKMTYVEVGYWMPFMTLGVCESTHIRHYFGLVLVVSYYAILSTRRACCKYLSMDGFWWRRRVHKGFILIWFLSLFFLLFGCCICWTHPSCLVYSFTSIHGVSPLGQSFWEPSNRGLWQVLLRLPQQSVLCSMENFSFIFPEAASPNKPPYSPLAVAFAANSSETYLRDCKENFRTLFKHSME